MSEMTPDKTTPTTPVDQNIRSRMKEECACNPVFTKARKLSLIIGWLWIGRNLIISLSFLLLTMFVAGEQVDVGTAIFEGLTPVFSLWTWFAIGAIYLQNDNRLLAVLMGLSGVSTLYAITETEASLAAMIINVLLSVLMIVGAIALWKHPLFMEYRKRSKELIQLARIEYPKPKRRKVADYTIMEDE